MTVDDTSRIHDLHQIFDGKALNIQQKDIAILYAIGCTIDEIAIKKQVKQSTVRGHLNTIKIALSAVSLSDIRTVVLLRILTKNNFST